VNGGCATSSPGEPSVAVFPFRNLSDPAQQHFSDGMTEDIIMDLSRWFDPVSREQLNIFTWLRSCAAVSAAFPSGSSSR
jgi:adenylate cyclase